MDEAPAHQVLVREAQVHHAQRKCRWIMHVVGAISVLPDFTTARIFITPAQHLENLDGWAAELDQIPEEIKWYIKEQYLHTFEALNRKRMIVNRWLERWRSSGNFQSQYYQDLDPGQQRFCSLLCTTESVKSYADQYLLDLEPRRTALGHISFESTWMDKIRDAQLNFLFGDLQSEERITLENQTTMCKQLLDVSMQALIPAQAELRSRLERHNQFKQHYTNGFTNYVPGAAIQEAAREQSLAEGFSSSAELNEIRKNQGNWTSVNKGKRPAN